VIKNIGVKYFGGWNNRFAYKNLEFSFLFQFVGQNQWNYNSLTPTPGTKYNQPVEVLNVWSATNPGGQYMPYSSGASSQKGLLHGYLMNSTRAVSDASYIRLKNVQLSYRLPVNKYIQDIRLYVQGQNLWTITNYFGIDPEFVTIGFLPPLKTWSFGVQLNF
jgi:TonB dependent receptor.